MQGAEHEEAIDPLVMALFHPSAEIAKSAKSALLLRGRSFVPSLIKAISSSRTPSYWNKEGISHILDLLREGGDERASTALLYIAQQNTPIRSNFVVNTFAIALACFAPLFIWGSIYNAFGYTRSSIGMLGYVLETFFSLIFLAGFLVFTSMTLFSPLFFIRVSRLRQSFSHSALKALAMIQDKRMFPYLIHLAWGPGSTVKREALEAIKPLIPMVTKADASLISITDEQILCNGLSKSSQEVSLSILHVLECLGTATSLQPLQRFVRTCKDKVVLERAKTVYEVVNARADLIEDKEVLLRASEMPDQHETLLRPSREQHDPKEIKELLQPVNNPNAEGD